MLNNLPSAVILDLQEELSDLYRLSIDRRIGGIDIPGVVYQIFEAIGSVELSEKTFILNNIVLDLSYINTTDGKCIINPDNNIKMLISSVINKTCADIEKTLKFLGGKYHPVLCYVFDRMLDETTVILIPFTDATSDNYPL